MDWPSFSLKTTKTKTQEYTGIPLLHLFFFKTLQGQRVCAHTNSRGKSALSIHFHQILASQSLVGRSRALLWGVLEAQNLKLHPRIKTWIWIEDPM